MSAVDKSSVVVTTYRIDTEKAKMHHTKKGRWSLAGAGASLILIIFIVTQGAALQTTRDFRSAGLQKRGTCDNGDDCFLVYAPTTSKPPSQPTSTQTPGDVPRDFGVGTGDPGSVSVWALQDDGHLSLKPLGGDWSTSESAQFLIAPIVVPGIMAIAVKAPSGALVYMKYNDGAWADDWEEIGGEFKMSSKWRPAAVSRAKGLVDVVGIDTDGNVLRRTYNGTEWSTEWQNLGGGFMGEVSVASWGPDRLDVVASTGSEIHAVSWTDGKDKPDLKGWSEEGWQNLGMPNSGLPTHGWPMAVSWEEGSVDVVMVTEEWGVSHKTYTNGAWGSEWKGLRASNEGYDFANTQALVRGGEEAPFAHLVSRGTDDCIHYTSFNGTDWDEWTFLWCLSLSMVDYPTRYLSLDATDNGNGVLDVVARNISGNLLHYGLQLPISPDFWYQNVTWDNLGQGA